MQSLKLLSEQRGLENLRKLPKKLKALPIGVAYSFKGVGERAANIGVNAFAQQVVAGFFASELKKIRTDQVWTLVQNGAFLADLIDENHLPAKWEGMLRLLRRFIDLRSIEQRLDDLITPELIAGAVKEANIEAYGLIINSDAGGPKWFYDQTAYMRNKIRRIISRGVVS